jgi:hypothetical protein
VEHEPTFFKTQWPTTSSQQQQQQGATTSSCHVEISVHFGIVDSLKPAAAGDR